MPADSKYATAYNQALYLWNKNNGNKNMRPKRDTPEYHQIKAIEADIKSGKIASQVRTKADKAARRKPKVQKPVVAAAAATVPQAKFTQVQVKAPEAIIPPPRKIEPETETPDVEAFDGNTVPAHVAPPLSITPFKPALEEPSFRQQLADQRTRNRDMYFTMRAIMT